MSQKILLLRGINVGGRNSLRMKDLRELLEGLGAIDVQTYIQSGNVVFTGDLTADIISNAIELANGFCPTVHVLEEQEFRDIAAANPFEVAEGEGKSLHVWFLTAPAMVDEQAAQKLAVASERFGVFEKAIYLHAPDGIGRSKLAVGLERLSGVPTTARNWNTIIKLLEMLDGS